MDLPYATEVHELVEIERQIQLVYLECEEMGVNVQQIQSNSTPPTAKEIHEISAEIEQLLRSIGEISKNSRILETVECNLIESKCVLEFCHDFFSSARLSVTKDSLTRALLHDATIAFPMHTDFVSTLEYVTGTVSIKYKYAFERMLWRVCKGNFCITYSKINIMSYDSCWNTTSKAEKQSFFLFFHGETIKIKILQICEGFHCNLIHCPESPEIINEMITDISIQIADLKVIASKTEAQKIDMLRGISGRLYPALVKVHMMKGLYFVLNQLVLDPGKRFYIGKYSIIFVRNPPKSFNNEKNYSFVTAQVSFTKLIF